MRFEEAYPGEDPVVKITVTMSGAEASHSDEQSSSKDKTVRREIP